MLDYLEGREATLTFTVFAFADMSAMTARRTGESRRLVFFESFLFILFFMSLNPFSLISMPLLVLRSHDASRRSIVRPVRGPLRGL